MDNSNNIRIMPLVQEEGETVSFSFHCFFNRCVKNWKWFVLTLALSLGIAGLYLLMTRPVYTRSATVLIKEATTRRMATSDIESVLSFSGGGTMSSKVVNEVIAFESPALMQEVVSRLGLATDYSYSGFFRSNAIYGAQVPVNVTFMNIPDNASASFVLVRDGEGCQLTKFVYRINKEKVKSKSIKCAVGDTVDTPAGRIVLNSNPLFTGEWKKPVIVARRPQAVATAIFSSRLSAEAADTKNKSDVLSIKIRDNSVQRADDVLDMLINVYNEKWVEDKNKMSVSTSDFITDRLYALEKELGDVDNNISNYKSRNLLPDVKAASELIMSQSKETARMIQELSNQLYMLKYIKNYLASNPGTETLIPAAASIGSNAVASQIAEYNEMLLRRNSVRSNSGEKNPVVQDMTASLVSMRKVVEVSVDNQIGSVNKQIEALDKDVKQTNVKIAQSPSQAKYLSSVGRQQKVKESLYLYLLQKREENELSQAFAAYNTRVITPPMGIARPSSPKRMSVLLIAFLLGLLIPLAVCYILEITDTKVRRQDDLDSLTIPRLGVIPAKAVHGGFLPSFRSHENKDDGKILIKQSSRNLLNEAFRILRTNLEFVERENGCPIIASTSFEPGSGKTFVSINEAAALAIKGSRVLVIDADMRRGACSGYVRSPKPGLSDYLAGIQDDIDKITVKVSGFEGLYVIPVGSIPPNPSELVSLPVFGKMLESLRTKYDYIFVDCPPIDLVADTQIIAQYASRVMFVVRAGLFDKKNVPTLQKIYDDKRFNNLCYVLNGVESEMSYYGSSKYYGK